MRKAIVVGSGAGGATVAKELQGTYDVTVLEAGGEFRPFSTNLSRIEILKRAGLMRDEREISLLFREMKTRKTRDHCIMVNGCSLGGTTTLATGNALRMDHDLKALGIDLDEEFEDLYREIPISTEHIKRWRPATRRAFEIFQEMNLHPQPLPKMGDNRKCINCGRCVLGCQQGAKWDSRIFLTEAVRKGASVMTGCAVDRVIIEGGIARGVAFRKGWRPGRMEADLIVLAAGGFGTPAILKRSGVECTDRLFVDHVLTIAGRLPGARQNCEISMPFAAQCHGYILAPYFDYLSYFFSRSWKFKAGDTYGIMIKIADECAGTVSGKKIEKSLTQKDKAALEEASAVCAEILCRLGVKKEEVVRGTVNAGHPGGMLPLTAKDVESMHPSALPELLYAADSTLFPSSLGNPPMLTIMALAKRVSRICGQLCA
ncbi:MAG TPA: GMC family oxidoreductase N-terminal domain-containing protein [Bacteroidota bacterium]|nr:GMC family oxidoreductase N-terminal domain-containing protein [Bacteroidota bacterium]